MAECWFVHISRKLEGYMWNTLPSTPVSAYFLSSSGVAPAELNTQEGGRVVKSQRVIRLQSTWLLCNLMLQPEKLLFPLNSSRQGYWSRLLFSSGELSDPGINPVLCITGQFLTIWATMEDSSDLNGHCLQWTWLHMYQPIKCQLLLTVAHHCSCGLW